MSPPSRGRTLSLCLPYRDLTAGRHRHGEYAPAQECHANERTALRHEHLDRALTPVPEDACPVVAGLDCATVGEHGDAPSQEGRREGPHDVERQAQGAGKAGIHGGLDFGPPPGAADDRQGEDCLAPIVGHAPAHHHGAVSTATTVWDARPLVVGTGADTVCGHSLAARPDAGEEEYTALAPRLHARERHLFIRGDRVITALDVDYHEGALVLLPQPRADAVLVDLSSTGHDPL